MFTAFDLCSFLVTIGGLCANCMLLFFVRKETRHRRLIQCSILLMPLLLLGVNVSNLLHYLYGISQDSHVDVRSLLALSFPLMVTCLLVGACGWRLFHTRALFRFLSRAAVSAPVRLQRQVSSLCQRMGASPCQLLVLQLDRPVAFVSGLRRPTIVLSTWMLTHLDEQEVEMVLAHEVAHIARRDYLLVMLAKVIRDTFFYLSPLRIVYRQLQVEKEHWCDELACRVAPYPLALASALTKVWLYRAEQLAPERHAVALSLLDLNTFAQGRVQRLLTPAAPPVRTQRRCFSILALVACMIFLFVQCGNLILLIAVVTSAF